MSKVTKKLLLLAAGRGPAVLGAAAVDPEREREAGPARRRADLVPDGPREEEDHAARGGFDDGGGARVRVPKRR